MDAWKQAGSPEVQPEALGRAKDKANRLLLLFREANSKHRMTSIKIGYLKIAYFIRKTASQIGMPWFVTTLVAGTVCLTFAIIVALLITRNLPITLAVGGLGFLGGSVAMLCLLLLPNNSEAGKQIASLKQQKSKQIGPLEAAKLGYEEAQQEYDKLASLHQLRTDCERASLELQQLEERYDAVCND